MSIHDHLKCFRFFKTDFEWLNKKFQYLRSFSLTVNLILINLLILIKFQILFP